jgi:hypothetical protein
VSGEACSLAGHLGLGKLIVLYDDNRITIDGHTDLSFSEDVGKVSHSTTRRGGREDLPWEDEPGVACFVISVTRVKLG